MIVQDSFTEVALTNLNLHTPEVGGVPTKHTSFSGDLVVDHNSGTLRKSGVATAGYTYPATPPSADYKLDVDFVCKTRVSGDSPAMYLRAATADHSGLRLTWGATANLWTLSRYVAGSPTSLGTFAQTLVAANTYHVHMRVEGTTISVWIGALNPDVDPPTITGSTGAVTAAGKVLAANVGSVSLTSTTGVHLENLAVDTLSATVVTPTNSTLPAISGAAAVGQTLTCSPGSWSGGGTITYAYQWKRGATNIGTNDDEYVVVEADEGENITCTVTATNSAGSGNATTDVLTVPVPIEAVWAPINIFRYTEGDWAAAPGVNPSLDYILAKDSIGLHDAIPAGVPSGYDWYDRSVNHNGGNPEDNTRLTPWGQVYLPVGGSYSMGDAQVEIRDMKCWLLRRSTGRWFQATLTTTVARWYPEDFVISTNHPIFAQTVDTTTNPGSILTAPGQRNGVSDGLPYGNLVHFYPGGARTTVNPEDTCGVAVMCRMRMIGTSPPQLLGNMGADYWPDAAASTGAKAVGAGRLKFIDTEWRVFGYTTAPAILLGGSSAEYR